MVYNLKSTNTYRVPTVEDALRLRKWLEKTAVGELTSFEYMLLSILSKREK